MTALFGVKDFVREVAAEKKRFAAGLRDRCAQAVIVAIESDEDSAFAELVLKIIARLFALVRPPNKIPINIQLDVAIVIRTIETIHHERNPRGAALQES